MPPIARMASLATHTAYVLLSTIISDTRLNLMIIMRGVPGAGKSTITEHLKRKLNTDCVCSADQYFMKDGDYQFDKKLIKDAHQYCQNKGV